MNKNLILSLLLAGAASAIQADEARLLRFPATNGQEVVFSYAGDLYKAPLIIWSGSMKEPVKVDKVCSAIDILPTLLDLFGVPYDSRILMGQDILDFNAEGIVTLNTLKSSYHFITDYGEFNFKTKKFTANSGL